MTEPKNLLEMMDWMDAHKMDAGQRYQYTRRFLDMRARQMGTPISGTFELTPLCNFNCSMCYVHLCPSQMHAKDVLSTDTWRDLMKQAIDAGMLYATLTGGECLTYPGIRDLILYLHSKGVHYTLLTNGSLLDDETVAFLAAHKPMKVQVTLYGSNEETYARVTGSRAFSQVMAGIERLRSASIACEMAITPNTLAEQDLEKQIHTVYEMGLRPQINTSLFSARKETGRNHESFEVSLSQYFRLLQLQASLDGRADMAEPPASECDTDQPTQRFGLTCAAGRSMFSISWDGQMHPCNMLRSIAADPLLMGFDAAWQTVHAGALAYPLPEECAACRYRPIAKGCAAEHAMGAPPGHASSTACAWCKGMVQNHFCRLSGPPGQAMEVPAS